MHMSHKQAVKASNRGDMLTQRRSLVFFSAGIGRTGTFIVIDILIDVIREKGESEYLI